MLELSSSALFRPAYLTRDTRRRFAPVRDPAASSTTTRSPTIKRTKLVRGPDAACAVTSRPPQSPPDSASAIPPTPPSTSTFVPLSAATRSFAATGRAVMIGPAPTATVFEVAARLPSFVTAVQPSRSTHLWPAHRHHRFDGQHHALGRRPSSGRRSSESGALMQAHQSCSTNSGPPKPVRFHPLHGVPDADNHRPSRG